MSATAVSTPTEEQLVERAQHAVSRCNWEIGFCAAEWTQRFARGRTDADFAQMVGLSPDQVYQRRRTADRFGNNYEQYPSLKWSHFYTVLTWDDAHDCLQWADENQATVAEMKAWRRAVRGEDLTSEPAAEDDFAGDPSVLQVSSEPAVVRDVNDSDADAPAAGKNAPVGERGKAVAGAARQSNGDDYAPFRSGAGSAAPESREDHLGTATAAAPQPSPLRVFKRAAASLERVNEALSQDALNSFADLPEDVRSRFTAAFTALQSKVGKIL